MFDWAETEKILLFSQAIIWLLLLLILVALFAGNIILFPYFRVAALQKKCLYLKI